jgi:hypothetical protein
MLRSFLLQLIKALWRARVTSFWPIWITTAIVAAVCVMWVVGHAATPMRREVLKSSTVRTPKYTWPRSAGTALLLFALFMVGYITLTLTWEDFAYPDNSMFTLNTLRGNDLKPPIWRDNGRFFPLGHQEFNLIRHFTGTVAGYHALPILQLLILSCILLVLDDQLSITARVGLTALALVTPAIVISFGGLIYDERNLVLWLACLLFSIKRFEQTRSTSWAVVAVLCAQIMIYYKETGFLLLLVFAVSRLVLRCRNADGSGWDYSRLRDKESRLDLCLAALAVWFLLYYAAVMFPHPNVQYAHDHSRSAVVVLLGYMKIDWLAWLFLAFVLSRVYLILRHRVTPSLLWDGVAFGGVAYFMTYLFLGMFSGYYLAPVDLIGVLYVGRFAILPWADSSWGTRVVIMVLACSVLVQDVSLSAFRIFERKNVIHGKAELAGVIKARYQSGEGNVQRLFFPFARQYSVMEFAAYLNYRGVPVEGAPAGSARLTRVTLVSRAVVKDSLCLGYETFVCHAGSSPERGDLVVILPDDDASRAAITPYRDGGSLLFLYECRPRVPQWLSPFFNRLHVISYAFPNKELPDRWMDASVSVWN